jgi:hypothetical protein
MDMTAFIIKMMYKTELATAYGCSLTYMRSMLKVTREKLKKDDPKKTDVFGEFKGRRLLTVKQIELFIAHNGSPYRESE